MKLTNVQYDLTKKILTVGVPGITSFIVTIGGLYGFSTDILVGTITAAATLAGVFLNIVCSRYEREQKIEFGNERSNSENLIKKIADCSNLES